MKKVVFLVIFTTVGLCATAQSTVIDSGSCGNSLTWVLTSDSTLTISGSDTMPDYYSWSGGTPWDAYKSDIATVVIGDSVITIGLSAFSSCYNLTSVTIPNNVTSIGGNAFSKCTNLISVTIPNSVTSIGNYAFEGCKNLISVTLSNSMTSIGLGIFMGSGLTSITIPNSIVYIDGNAFASCIGLKSITTHAIIPPVLVNSAFRDVPDTIPIYIPCGTLNSYRDDKCSSIDCYTGWGNCFSNFIEDCNSVKEIVQNKKIQIYPNPTTGQLTIDNGEWIIESIEMFDIYGKSVLRHCKRSEAIQKIDISHLANGVYILKINEVVRKIIKF